MHQIFTCQKLLLCTLILLSGLSGIAQTSELNLNFRAANVVEIFEGIQQQSKYTFNYNAADLNLQTRYRFTYDGKIEGALTHLAQLAGLVLKQNGNTILVRVLPSRMVKGKVTDRAGLPLAGVIVQLQNGGYVATTNGEGNFAGKVIMANPASAQLNFRMIGMRSFTTGPLGNKIEFDIQLEEDVTMMNDVIITSSYTPAKPREEVVGSISQINAEQLQVQRPIESLDKMLEGLVAGVYVESGTGLGTPVKVNIRGQNSLIPFGVSRSTSSQPLYVVDGIPIQEQSGSDASDLFNHETILNPLAGINPANIETISVLKDAAATTIYGANAANGVIIITTKSGRKGKTKINLSYNSGVSTFINRMKLLSGPEYYTLKREALINGGISTAAAEAAAGSNIIDTDWLGLISRNASYSNFNLDLSGGKDDTNYFFSAGYRNQQSASINNGIKEFYASLKLNTNLGKKLKFGVTISPSLGSRNGIDVFNLSTYLPPNIAPDDSKELELQSMRPNPVDLVSQNEDSGRTLTVNGNANLRYNVLPGFYLSATVGGNTFYSKQRKFQSRHNFSGMNANGSLRINDRNTYTWLGYVQAGYDKTFNEKHTVNIVAGYEAREETTSLLAATGNGFSYDKIRELGQARTKNTSSSEMETGTLSYYSQAGYDFRKKYFVTASARADRSSIFGGDRQLAVNAALGLGWEVTKEAFLEPGEVLNYLRLRSSYGSTGNSRIGSYAARGLYNFGYGNYSGDVAAIPLHDAAPNPDLGWEKNYKLNFGVDLTVFNRFRLTAEYYSNTIKNLISTVDVPLETGYGTTNVNSGDMRNKGFELSIDAEVWKQKNFEWSAAFNFGQNKNKILRLNEGFTERYSMPATASALKPGYSTSGIWGVRWAGINPANGQELFFAPDGSKVNRSSILKYGTSIYEILGDRLPKLQGGLVNRFRYKNFSLIANLQYSWGASHLISTTFYKDGSNISFSNMSVNLLDRWQQPGDVTEVARLSTLFNQVTNSSRYVYDMSYIKLSNVSLSYRLAELAAQKLYMRSASIFVNASNLIYWYKDKSEAGRNGIREMRYMYPETRTLSVGLTMGF